MPQDDRYKKFSAQLYYRSLLHSVTYELKWCYEGKTLASYSPTAVLQTCFAESLAIVNGPSKNLPVRDIHNSIIENLTLEQIGSGSSILQLVVEGKADETRLVQASELLRSFI